MKSTYLTGLVFILALTGVVLYTHYDKKGAIGIPEDMGAYMYLCSGGMGGFSYSMVPSADLSSIELTDDTGVLFNTVKLGRVDAAAGEAVRYTNTKDDLIVSGTGERMKLRIPSTGFETTCTPLPSPNMAPFNWGDPEEGAGATQNTAADIQENIVGKWRSVEDPLFTREFTSSGSVIDSYDDTADTPGSWIVFSATQPKEVSFPITPGTTYVQLKLGGDTLNFSVDKLTPENLEMTYIERGNKLRFSRN